MKIKNPAIFTFLALESAKKSYRNAMLWFGQTSPKFGISVLKIIYSRLIHLVTCQKIPHSQIVPHSRAYGTVIS